jgi:glycosyltransferase involved in cell wall biosynthesis
MKSKDLGSMPRILLVNGGTIPHYRIPVYGYLGQCLHSYGFELIVTAGSIQPGNSHPVQFEYAQVVPTIPNLVRLLGERRIDAIIYWVNLRELYLFPLLIAAKLLGKKTIYWGHGRDLANPQALIKNMANAAEHALSDAIILYAEHLRKYVQPAFQKKVFVANNTLMFDHPGIRSRDEVLNEYGIQTRKNIICIGRFEMRKRVERLVEAHAYLNRPDIGLILVGPDTDGILDGIKGENIYKLGPIYGEKKFDLLLAADVYCLPGAVGLSIVDAFQCGLPLVTEEGDESPEIMYLKDGENGFVVPRGDMAEMARKLQLLLDDNALRQRFSEAAKREISENGHIGRLCSGFKDALSHALCSGFRDGLEVCRASH